MHAGGQLSGNVEGLLQGRFTAHALAGIGSFTSRHGTYYDGEVRSCGCYLRIHSGGLDCSVINAPESQVISCIELNVMSSVVNGMSSAHCRDDA